MTTAKTKHGFKVKMACYSCDYMERQCTSRTRDARRICTLTDTEIEDREAVCDKWVMSAILQRVGNPATAGVLRLRGEPSPKPKTEEEKRPKKFIEDIYNH